MYCHSEHDHAALVFGGHLCGSEPARDGVCRFDIDVTGRLSSRAGSLPQWNGGVRSICVRQISLWEPGLPAMASAHSISMWQGDCHRGQVESSHRRSHRVLVVDAAFAYGADHCGSRACPRWQSDKHRMMSDVGSRLRRLAPLPTTTSESAGLCGLDTSGSLISVTAHQ
jgi:hypothetical protein